MSTPTTPDPVPLMSRPQTLAVMAACIVTLLLSILDLNIVTTTGTAIARQLDPGGGLRQVPWLVVVYALVSTVVQPLYGKLCDTLGVRQVFLAAVGLFIGGSLLCAAATSMTELLVFRGLQGLGGGGLMSVTVVLIGHLRASDPGRGQGANALGGVMVGLGLVCGPLLGGLLVAHGSWRWIFLINVPAAVAAWVVIATCLRLAPPESGIRVDLAQVALLAGAAGSLLLCCQWGGQRYGWLSPVILGLLAAGGLDAMLFARRQARSAAPLFPPHLLRHRTLRILTALQFATGCGMAAATIYLTLDLQVVRGFSPASTGLLLMPMAAGLAAGAAVGAIMLNRGTPLRWSITCGTGLSTVCLLAIAFATAGAPLALFLVLLGGFGAGVGMCLGNEVILVQVAVRRADLGIATTGVRFAETIGASVAAAVFATIFSAGAGPHLSVGHAHLTGTLTLIFALGGTLLAAATLVATRLPSITIGGPRPDAAQPAPRPAHTPEPIPSDGSPASPAPATGSALEASPVPEASPVLKISTASDPATAQA
jgi:MFS family permease